MRTMALLGMVALGFLLAWGLRLIRNASLHDLRMHEAWLKRERERELRHARDGR